MCKMITQGLMGAGLIVSMLLFGCSGSGSDGSSSTAGAGLLTVVPFGVTSTTVPIDFDGDGFWDQRVTTTFSYDAEGRVIEQTVLTEYDDNADGVVDSQTIATEAYDPATGLAVPAALAAVQQSTAQLAKDGGRMTVSIDSTVLLYDYARYVLNADGTLVVVYSSTRTYTYDADGNRTVETSVYKNDTNGDQVIDRITTSTYTFTYDANGNQLEYSYRYDEDSDGDGVAESGRSEIRRYEYDADGKQISYYYAVDDNNDGTFVIVDEYDIDYTYYSDGSVETKVDNTCTTAYTYDSSGDVASDTRSCDYDSNLIADYVSSNTYIYNGSGLLTEKQNDQLYFDNSTAAPWYAYRTIYSYGYDTASRVDVYTLSSWSDYTGHDFEPADNFNNSVNTYSYNAAGQLLAYKYTYQYIDPADEVTITSGSGYGADFTYDPVTGSLAEMSEWNFSYSGGEEIIDYRDTTTYTYDADSGKLLTSVYVEDDGADGVSDSIETRTLTYDTTGRVDTYILAFDYDADAVPDDTVTVEYAYSGDVVTVTITSVSTAVPSALGLPGVVTYTLVFGANGIPTGTADMTVFRTSNRDPAAEEEWDGDDDIKVSFPLPALIYLLESGDDDREK